MTCKPLVTGRHFAVAAGHPLSAMAAAEVLRSGGNAIDAGVAAGIATGVLESILVSFGGVAPIILYSAEHDEIVTISGLGTWPAAVDPEYFIRRHGGRIPLGILRTVVPAAPDAWITALSRYGRMGFAEVASFAIEFARDGFQTYQFFTDRIAEKREGYSRYSSTAAIYLPDGAPPVPGTMFRQPELAASLQLLADIDRAAARSGGRQAGLAAARAAFYEGEIAREMVAHVQGEGGELTLEDLAGFSVDVEPPVSVSFGGWQVNGCSTWCQGPMLLQALKILEGLDLKGMGHNSPDYVHYLAEAIKLAAVDRDRYYGDPKFVDVPLDRLLSEAHARKLAQGIDPGRAITHPDPREAEAAAKADLAVGDSTLDTSYVCVVDKAGNAFSATPSDAPHHAAVAPKLGFIVSARGSQSWTDPTHPAGIAPGKRPRLTPNPALATGPDGRIMPFGSPGGDVQTQAMLQGFLNRVLFGFDTQTAVEAPRFATYDFPSSWEPHERQSQVLKLETTLYDDVAGDLAARGHEVVRWPERVWRAGSLSMIDHDRAAGHMSAGSDPRREAQALGW